MSNGVLDLVTVFVLAAFVGVEVISKVPSVLHTPLMSGSNAIHGAVLIGAIAVLSGARTVPEQILGFVAVALATVNVVGGFAVTDRMLQMFRAKPERQRPAVAQRSDREGPDRPAPPGPGGTGP